MWRDFFDHDTVRVIGAAGVGSTVTLTDLDLVIKILIGLASLAYISKKAIDVWLPPKSPK